MDNTPKRVPKSCGIINDPDRKHFNYMWKLVKQASLSLPFWRPVWGIFTDELIMSLFWEESTFRNRPQFGKNCAQLGPAFGFGQIESAGFKPYKALTKNKPPFNDIRAVLTNDLWSAQLTMRMLHYLYMENPGSKNKMAALKGYGSAFQFPDRIPKIQGWLDSEKLLRKGKRTYRNPDGYWLPPRAEIEKALLKAKPDSAAFLPEVLEGIP